MLTSSARILLVDDALSNLMFLENILQSEGYGTVLAQSGKEALAIAKQSCPDLVLLDLIMPEMDGFEVCQEFRADPSLQHVPIIFVSALDDEKSKLKGLGLLGDDYLTKPVQKNLVLAKVANVLQLNQLRRQQSQLRIRQHLQEEAKRRLAEALEVNETLLEKLRLFVPDQLLERIAPGGVESIQLGNATEVEVTVMFCDIRNFTAITESQQTTQTFEWLNAFFSRMNQAVTLNHGFIDKYLGDAMMVVFDRPQHHAQDAFNAALHMQETLADFNFDRAQFNLLHPVNIGIGIHTGRAVIGTIGCDRRMDPTVIGDVVNTASRLEELTKLYGCQIIVSDTAVMHLNHPEQFHLRAIDRLAPRGKEQQLSLYELVGASLVEIVDFADYEFESASSTEKVDFAEYGFENVASAEKVDFADYEFLKTPLIDFLEFEDFELRRTPPIEIIDVEEYELVKAPMVEIVDFDDDLQLKSADPSAAPFLIQKYPLLRKIFHYFQRKWHGYVNRCHVVPDPQASLPRSPEPEQFTSSSEPIEMSEVER
jgi:two-component system sensor histidine kinase ChiS